MMKHCCWRSAKNVERDAHALAAMRNTTVEEVEQCIEAARQKPFYARERRVKPARDEKILTGWNGLMLAAFAEAARVLKRVEYSNVAKRNAEFLSENVRDANGRVKHSYKDGQARLNGYLEDYANLAEGLLTPNPSAKRRGETARHCWTSCSPSPVRIKSSRENTRMQI